MQFLHTPLLKTNEMYVFHRLCSSASLQCSILIFQLIYLGIFFGFLLEVFERIGHGLRVQTIPFRLNTKPNVL